jgi:hypothetical protein
VGFKALPISASTATSVATAAADRQSHTQQLHPELNGYQDQQLRLWLLQSLSALLLQVMLSAALRCC